MQDGHTALETLKEAWLLAKQYSFQAFIPGKPGKNVLIVFETVFEINFDISDVFVQLGQ